MKAKNAQQFKKMNYNYRDRWVESTYLEQSYESTGDVNSYKRIIR